MNPTSLPHRGKDRRGDPIAFSVGKIECTSANILLETSKPGKLPTDIAVASFTLTDAKATASAPDKPMHFDAELTNPRPVGTIHSTGTVGPWQTADPGESPIEGGYTFDHADLSTIKGIAGILSSTGGYRGTIRNVEVDGETDTPDFRLTHFGNALPLHTRFHANVDATDGDTWLDPVDATLGHSNFSAQGKVVRDVVTDPATGHLSSRGHDIDLQVNIDSARVEDFLHLASSSQEPLLTGALTLKATLHISPGPEPVHKRLNLKGAFNLDQARFTSAKIQDKITELSLRGQGRPKELKDANPAATRSAMQGSFTMAEGVITLPALAYTVPGATIDLAGTYGVDGGALAFNGTAKLQATISQMVGGVWGVLLKPANRIFEKDGAGTDLRIHIDGTREDPHFGVDFSRPKKAAPETPAEKQ